MPLVLILLLSTAFPSGSKTSWMRPESFRLTVGMTREAAVKVLAESGWTTKPGDSHDQLIVDYSGDKSMTLTFRKNRLRSIRFELFTLLPEIAGAFGEEKAYLRKKFGEPRKLKSARILLYDATLPNVIVVLSSDPKSQHGRRGMGVLVVRYYDPTHAK